MSEPARWKSTWRPRRASGYSSATSGTNSPAERYPRFSSSKRNPSAQITGPASRRWVSALDCDMCSPDSAEVGRRAPRQWIPMTEHRRVEDPASSSQCPSLSRGPSQKVTTLSHVVTFVSARRGVSALRRPLDEECGAEEADDPDEPEHEGERRNDDDAVGDRRPRADAGDNRGPEGARGPQGSGARSRRQVPRPGGGEWRRGA